MDEGGSMAGGVFVKGVFVCVCVTGHLSVIDPKGKQTALSLCHMP